LPFRCIKMQPHFLHPATTNSSPLATKINCFQSWLPQSHFSEPSAMPCNCS
jgi:hypothetical protein